MTYLSNNLKLYKWKKSLIFSLISSVIIFVTYINPPSEPKSAGGMFAYNFSFFFPMLVISFVAGLIAVLYLIRFVNDSKVHEIKYKKVRVIITLILLLPMLIHLIPLLVLILMPVD
ncbi:MAG: hypothetical protein ACQETL_03245 [Bacteroidota bacterium]